MFCFVSIDAYLYKPIYEGLALFPSPAFTRRVHYGTRLQQ